MWNSLDYDGVKETKMIISIDFDDTYTKDPKLWDRFAVDAIARGHTVYCVSARSVQDMDDPKRSIGLIISENNCIGTNLEPKREFMRNVHKIHVNVWIDDMPEMIVERVEGLYML